MPVAISIIPIPCPFGLEIYTHTPLFGTCMTVILSANVPTRPGGLSCLLSHLPPSSYTINFDICLQGIDSDA
jgi:hypothetical protein